MLGDLGHPEVAHHLWNVNTWPSWRWLYENGYDTANSYWNDFHVPGKLPSARFIQSEKPVAAVWCYESLCGIKPRYDKPGFKHFLLAPVPPPAMKWAEAEVQTVQGLDCQPGRNTQWAPEVIWHDGWCHMFVTSQLVKGKTNALGQKVDTVRIGFRGSSSIAVGVLGVRSEPAKP